MKVGDRVRIIESVLVYHHPQHKKEPLDLKGLEGQIVNILKDWRGRPISPNLPVVVELEKNLRFICEITNLKLLNKKFSGNRF